MFDNKVFLITGGTGSFGNAVTKRLLKTQVKEIKILSRDEKKQEEMRFLFSDKRLSFYLGDVRSDKSIKNTMSDVNYVFHAAALKQVPSCEFFPVEAIKTNSLGADNVISAAEEERAEKLIVLSTDKAVYPINAMGMSKALMEKIMIARSKKASSHGTILCGTRYGNVMASRGSVIPLFIKQIKNHEPITITNPNMTRFMMSIEDAVDLVLFAYEHGLPGDIFVQKAPGATIKTLVDALQSIFNSKSSIHYIKSRHGEKLYETLLTKEELIKAEDLGGYYKIPPDNRNLNYSEYSDENIELTVEEKDYNSSNTDRLDVERMIKLLLTLDYVKEQLGTI